MQKFREEHKAFVAEGEKIAAEWLSAPNAVNMIVATEAWAGSNLDLIGRHPEAAVHVVKEHELEALSGMHTPSGVLLVLPVPPPDELPHADHWYLALDNIQDPGNMGTIIRIADWFGVRVIVCSPGCVDFYNPKVVQSAMGSHLRVGLFTGYLPALLDAIPLPKFAATLDGESVYGLPRLNSGILIIGNESKGISEAVLQAATRRVTIPRKGGAESLNAGVSAGILCALLLPC